MPSPMDKYNITTFSDLKGYIASDLFRYTTSCSPLAFLRGWYITGFRYTFFMRWCKYLASKGMMAKPLFLIARVALRHYSVKYGFQIPYQADVGPGLSIGHYGPIIINPSAVIGANCNITVGVLLGLNHKVDDEGRSLGFEYPVVGNRVALGNGVKVIGGVVIGDDSAVGVNSVVTRSIPPRSIAVGSPAKVISDKGSAALVGSMHPFTLTGRFNKS